MPPLAGGIRPNGSFDAWPTKKSNPGSDERLPGSMTFLDKTVLDDAGLSEATAGDYLELLKPRVMSLVVFTAFVGMDAAPVALNHFIAVAVEWSNFNPLAVIARDLPRLTAVEADVHVAAVEDGLIIDHYSVASGTVDWITHKTAI